MFFKCTAKNVLLQRNHSIDLYALPLMHRVDMIYLPGLGTAHEEIKVSSA